MSKSPEKKIVIPENVNVDVKDRTVRIKGSYGENFLSINNVVIGLKKEENKLILFAKGKFTKNEKRLINTNASHLKNMIKGTVEPYTYKLKICSGHFPMNVSVEKGNVIVKNFLGEKMARVARILEGSEVKVNGDEIIVTSVNKETAGQTASNREQCTRVTNKDRRIFQDGIYITQKGGKSVV